VTRGLTHRLRAGLPVLVVAGLLGLVTFQAWAYYFRLDLSLGPRVILQPWLLQRGFVMYENVADLHSPLMPLSISALPLVFYDGLQQAKVVLVALLCCTTLLTFWAGQRSLGWLGGLGAALFFVAWSPMFGFGKLWHESFLTPLYALLLLLYDASAPRRKAPFFLCVGLIGGIAILVKQHAAIVFAAFVVWSALASWSCYRSMPRILRETGLMIGGAVVPVLAYAIWQYARAGTLQGLLYWTLVYNLTSEYKSLAALPPSLSQVGVIVSSCLLAPVALLYLIESRRRGDKLWLSLGWGLTLLATSSLSLYPRFGFFHLQPALPAIAWLSSLTLDRALRSNDSPRVFVTGVALSLSFYWLIMAGSAYQRIAQVDPPRRIWEYSDLMPLAAEIRRHVGTTDCVYVFPDDEATANLYYLMRCLPPRSWIFHYPWYMSGPIKSRILQMLEDDPPEWILHFPGRWDVERHAPEIMDYISTHYQRVAELHWAQGQAWLLRRSS